MNSHWFDALHFVISISMILSSSAFCIYIIPARSYRKNLHFIRCTFWNRCLSSLCSKDNMNCSTWVFEKQGLLNQKWQFVRLTLFFFSAIWPFCAFRKGTPFHQCYRFESWNLVISAGNDLTYRKIPPDFWLRAAFVIIGIIPGRRCNVCNTGDQSRRILTKRAMPFKGSGSCIWKNQY